MVNIDFSSVQGNEMDSFQQSWLIGKRIGSGGFGQVMNVTERRTGVQYVMKLSNHNQDASFERELSVYRELKYAGNLKGFAILKENGCLSHGKYIIMTKLGQSLFSTYSKRPLVYNSLLGKISCKPFSLRRILYFGRCAIRTIYKLHSLGYVHRDIKPENFAFGRQGHGEDRQVHLFDFDNARKYLVTVGNEVTHVPFLKDTTVSGTLRYQSINSHKGYNPSRRDDLESLVYCMVYLHKGLLPWNLYIEETYDSKDQIAEMKQNISTSNLVDEMTDYMAEFYDHIRSLGHSDCPNYHLLDNLLRNAFHKQFTQQKIQPEDS